MINRFDSFYSQLRKRNLISSVLRSSIRLITNYTIPFYFRVTKSNFKLPENDIVISLTSFPDRINKVWLVLECIFRQDTLPGKVVLWLSKTQFPNLKRDLPSNLLFYCDNGMLDVRFVEDDLRSHKKYYYAFNEFVDCKIILVDDDIFYPTSLISALISLSNKFPNAICCLRAHEVLFKKDILARYKDWRPIYEGEVGPESNVFFTSGGGSLYKSSFFDRDVFDKEVIKKTCFNADDVWLNVMARKNGTLVAKANYYSNILPIFSSGSKLSAVNNTLGQNDEQLSNVLGYYSLSGLKIFKS